MLNRLSAFNGGTLDNLVLDLHGKTWAEALEEFVDAYNGAVRRGGRSSRAMHVIHGYGSAGGPGILRTRFRRFLEKYDSQLEFTLGEKADGNPGYTIVTPLQPLPGADAALSELVWDYCEQPKTLNKITGQFRRYGMPRVQRAVKSLEGQKRLQKGVKSKKSVYQAV